MTHHFPLESLYMTWMEKWVCQSDEDLAVLSFLKQQPLQLDEIVDSCTWHETLMSSEKAIDNWKHLLTINLLHYLSSSSSNSLAGKIRLFEHQPWNQSSQYFRALVTLNHILARMPVPEVGSHLLDSGAALIDLQEYCPWLAIPYVPYHLEFGIFLCLLTHLTKKEELREKVIHLAKWQLNTLDSQYRPFPSLFVRENEGNGFHHLILYYLLFRGASSLTEGSEFDSATEALSSLIKEAKIEVIPSFFALWVLIEKLFIPSQKTPVLPFPLPEHIYDPSTALVGYRSENQHAVCTLHGGYTGLGSLRHEDIEMINYGPQYLPLEDCRGFGIEGNYLSDHGLRKSSIELRRQGFLSKGCVRLVDQPPASLIQTNRFRGIWLEVVQEFKQPCFNLKTTLLGLNGWEAVAFSFFVRARKCHIQEKMCLLPGTLTRYEGAALPLYLEGAQAKLQMTISHFKGHLQVIPLGGSQNFWGANFLIAYLLHPHQRNYEWQIAPDKS